MEKQTQLILKLNWFYSLELNQVDMYLAESEAVEDLYQKKLLERVAEIEQGHVDSLAEKIRLLGGHSTHLGEVVAPVTGRIAGKVANAAGLANLLRFNIALENKAMEDYKQAISTYASERDLYDLLWSNLIDEDLHTAWFGRELQLLKEQMERE